MCKWGTEVKLWVTVPAHLSHSGEKFTKETGIDACISHIVTALNNAGMPTSNCCCGHGKSYGWIALHDGREIRLFHPGGYK